LADNCSDHSAFLALRCVTTSHPLVPKFYFVDVCNIILTL